MKVLIVDDSKQFQVYVRSVVERQGYEARVANHGEEGLALSREFQPDLIISDVQMPIMDGLELLQAVRKENQDVIVIMVTAFGSEENVIEALRLGANNYLRKPCDFKELREILRKYESLILDRRLEKEIRGMVLSRTTEMRMDNRIELIPTLAHFLVQEATAGLNPADRLGVRLGLVEILVNAVEHGNLGITIEEKKNALDTGFDKLMSLYQERLGGLPPEKGSVEIKFRLDQEGCEWLISDHGDGFNWRELPDPMSGQDQLASGRGIFISRLQFDEVEYMGRGNAVRLVKRRNKPLT